jgi:hypothetical protein
MEVMTNNKLVLTSLTAFAMITMVPSSLNLVPARRQVTYIRSLMMYDIL